MLDNSLVIYCSDMHHGDHAAFDLPSFCSAAGAASSVRTSWSSLPEAIEDIRQLRDLHFTVLNDYFKLDVKSFGEDRRGIPNQRLTQILA